MPISAQGRDAKRVQYGCAWRSPLEAVEVEPPKYHHTCFKMLYSNPELISPNFYPKALTEVNKNPIYNNLKLNHNHVESKPKRLGI